MQALIDPPPAVLDKRRRDHVQRHDDATGTVCTDELPVLSAVVRTGNASIIQSHRLGHQVLDELETLRLAPRSPRHEQPQVSWQDIPDRFSVLTDLAGNFDATLDFEQPDFATGIEANFSRRDTEATLSDDDIELMVDALIDRHVSELRRDIRSLLTRALQTR